MPKTGDVLMAIIFQWQIIYKDFPCILLRKMVPIVGDVTCMATILDDMEVEAHFLANEDGIIAGIALAEMVFNEVDPSLKVLRQ